MRRPDGSMSKKDARFLAARGVLPKPTHMAFDWGLFGKPVEFTFTVDTSQYQQQLTRLTTYAESATFSMTTLRQTISNMQSITIAPGTLTITTT